MWHHENPIGTTQAPNKLLQCDFYTCISVGSTQIASDRQWTKEEAMGLA